MKKPQSLAGVIRQRLDDIEARLDVGVRQEVIISELAAEGYETSLQNFRNELWRARKRKEQGKETKAVEKAVKNVAATHNKTPAKQVVDPLKKPAGFNYGGTKDASEDDLI